MKIDLKNKVALVTGGATGLGRGMAIALSKSNAKVIITSRNMNKINKTLKELNKDASGYNLDLTNDKDLQKLYKNIKKKYGGVDIIINNIGHTLGIKDPFASYKDFDRVMNINFITTVKVNNKFIHDMKKKKWGRIINITSLAGIEVSGPSSFNASKAALTAYTRSVGRQLAIEKQNIVMTAVAPGVIPTEDGH